MRNPPSPLLLALLPWTLVSCGTLSYYDAPAPDDTEASTEDTDDTDDPTTWGDDDDGGGPGPDPEPPAEDCSAPGDEDEDGDADCDDPDCDVVCDADGDGFLAEAVGGADCEDDDGAVHPGALDDCDGVDDDCDLTVDGDGDGDGTPVCDDCDDADPAIDCQVFADDFETGVLSPAAWVTGGNVGWGTTNAAAQSGSWSALGGAIGHSQLTTLTLTLDYAGVGNLSFWHTGSTEATYDFFRFFVDGALVDQWSGSWAWQQTTVTVGPGVHTFEWRYVKDGTIHGGLDQVAIDNVTTVNGSL